MKTPKITRKHDDAHIHSHFWRNQGSNMLIAEPEMSCSGHYQNGIMTCAKCAELSTGRLSSLNNWLSASSQAQLPGVNMQTCGLLTLAEPSTADR